MFGETKCGGHDVNQSLAIADWMRERGSRLRCTFRVVVREDLWRRGLGRDSPQTDTRRLGWYIGDLVNLKWTEWNWRHAVATGTLDLYVWGEGGPPFPEHRPRNVNVTLTRPIVSGGFAHFTRIEVREKECT